MTPRTQAINDIRAQLADLTSGYWVTFNPSAPVDGRPRPDARAARDARAALVSLHPARRGVSRNNAKAQRKQTLRAKVQSIPPTRHERNRWCQTARAMRRCRYVEARRRGDSCAGARAYATASLASPPGPIGRKPYAARRATP